MSPLVTGTSRLLARSSRLTPPRIRFLFVGPQVRYPASFTLASRSNALRLTSLAVTCLREDLHLLIGAHAGRTSPRF
jgi:hypothetical protein